MRKWATSSWCCAETSSITLLKSIIENTWTIAMIFDPQVNIIGPRFCLLAIYWVRVLRSYWWCNWKWWDEANKQSHLMIGRLWDFLMHVSCLSQQWVAWSGLTKPLIECPSVSRISSGLAAETARMLSDVVEPHCENLWKIKIDQFFLISNPLRFVYTNEKASVVAKKVRSGW